MLQSDWPLGNSISQYPQHKKALCNTNPSNTRMGLKLVLGFVVIFSVINSIQCACKGSQSILDAIKELKESDEAILDAIKALSKEQIGSNTPPSTTTSKRKLKCLN